MNEIFFVRLSLSQTTNFRLFHTDKVCRRQFQINENGVKFPKRVAIFPFSTVFQEDLYCRYLKTGLVWERVKNNVGSEKMLVGSIFSFSHDVFLQCS